MLHLQLNLANTVSARIMNRIYCIILHRRCFCLVARPSRMHRMQFFGSAAQMVSLHFAERRRINTFVGIVWIWPDMILVSSRKAPVHLAIDLTPRDIQFSLGCDVSDNWKTVAWDATGKEDFSICDSIVHNNTIYTFGILRIDMDWHGLTWIGMDWQKATEEAALPSKEEVTEVTEISEVPRCSFRYFRIFSVNERNERNERPTINDNKKIGVSQLFAISKFIWQQSCTLCMFFNMQHVRPLKFSF